MFIVLIEKKKSTYKWTCSVQTRVIQGSAVLAFYLLPPQTAHTPGEPC